MLIVKGRLIGLNEYTNACRTNKYAGSKIKKEQQEFIRWQIINYKNKHKQVHITYNWYEQDKRRDIDNIAFAKKFINDCMVDMGILPGDGWGNVKGFTDNFYVDKTDPRIEIIIKDI